MKPKTPVKSYKCSICGIVLVNSKELLKHQIAAHVNKMFQCQSCNKIFDTKDKFENHTAEIHGVSQKTTIVPTSYDDSESRSRNIDQSIAQNRYNEIESNLFKKTIREKKARKRTRGPYRKSVSSLPS
jgi:uncharacterized C2H2 Zn-finger protein